MRDKANLSAWRRKHRLANLEKIRAYERAQYYKHKEKKLANVTAWSKANPEKVKTAKQKYKIKNKDACNARRKQWMLDNKEYMKEVRRRWRVENKHRDAAAVRKYQAAKLKRTPTWLGKDDFWLMEQAYELAALRTKMFGVLWTVDHIIPLQGKFVSGLHVPTNLRVIPGRENSSKGNQFLL